MATSSVQIANFALAKIGTDSTIESLTENSAEAKVCSLWYEHARRQALSAFSWSFAKSRVTLATHGDDPSDDWQYRYIYPTDCIKARFIFNPLGVDADPVPFTIENSATGTKSILTDSVDAILIYTKDVETPALYTEYFIETLATIIGAHIAYALTGKTKLAQGLAEVARKLLIFAPAMDAIEGIGRKPRDGEAIRARA